MRRSYCVRNKVFIIIAFILLITSSLSSCMAEDKKEAKRNLFDALENNDRQAVSDILDEYPKLVNEDYYTFITPIDAPNSSPLLTAIVYGDLDMVSLLVEKGADVNDSTVKIYPLHKALHLGKYDIAWYLIEHGADLSAMSGSWEESVAFCILSQKIHSDDGEKEQDQFELLKYVLENGAPLDPPIGCQEGIKTLLGLAAYQNNSLVVQYLLDEKIYDIDEIVNPKYTQKTALIIAVEQQSYNACQILLDYGANKSIKDTYDKTAVDYAEELNDERLIAMLNK